MKHAHDVPESPSARRGRPVSPGLESLILRCLAKKPEDRPPGTRALAEEPDGLVVAGRWTRADADAWWAAFRKPGEAPTAKAPTAVGGPTQANPTVVPRGV